MSKTLDLVFSMTATYRPELLSVTLESLFSVCAGLEKKKFPLVINIDPCPSENYSSLNKIKLLCDDYFNPVKYIEPMEPNFALAVRNVWSNIDQIGKIVFHLEEDWKFVRSFDIQLLVDRFLNVDLNMIKLMGKQKFRNKKQKQRLLRENYKNYCLGCVLYRSDIVNKISKVMISDVNPETQLFHMENIRSKLPKITKSSIQTFPRKMKKKCHIVEDIGGEWRRSRGIKLRDGVVWRPE